MTSRMTRLISDLAPTTEASTGLVVTRTVYRFCRTRFRAARTCASSSTTRTVCCLASVLFGFSFRKALRRAPTGSDICVAPVPRQRYVENCAFSRLALQFNRAMIHGDDLLDRSHTEARAVLPLGREERCPHA